MFFRRIITSHDLRHKRQPDCAPSKRDIDTVSVFPETKGLKDEAQEHLQPVMLTGTARELDAGFFEAVRQPLQKASGMLAGMKTNPIKIKQESWRQDISFFIINAHQ